MTLQRLSEHFKLKERLMQNEELLASLQSTAAPGAQVMTGMPHSSGFRDKVGDLAIEIADMKERIRYLQDELAVSEQEIKSFIDSIDNDYIRMIFRLRFLRGLTWKQVAAVVGGRNTEDGVKSACYRYLSTLE
ncbi:hypothetical protein RFF05_06705 [Bengtsoniella intestinalis]|uniref:hypothetical protein n=1 Tax=Bengtsoniella intestinalis TaxID=3073143 RepID=UPI00391F1719